MLETISCPYEELGSREKTWSPHEINNFVIENPTKTLVLQHHGKDIEEVAYDLLINNPDLPFYFTDVSQLQERVRLYLEYFIPEFENRRIAYAVKANPEPEMVDIIFGAGIQCADCASAGEAHYIKQLHPQAEVFINKPFQRVGNIIHALNKSQARHFTVQTREEIDLLLEIAQWCGVDDPLEVAVRMKAPRNSAKIDLSTKKFGATPDKVYELMKYIRDETPALPGISMHAGSQNEDCGSIIAGGEMMAEIAGSIGGIASFNLGGGIPANYHPEDNFDVRSYLEQISDFIRNRVAKVLSEKIKIIIEPGRSIVAEWTDLLVPIVGVDYQDAQRVIHLAHGLYAGLNDVVIHPGWKHPMKYFSLTRENVGSPQKQLTCGESCDGGDHIGERYFPINAQRGSYAHLLATGSYHRSQAAKDFNMLGQPVQVYYNF